MAEEENGGSTEALPPPPPVPLNFSPAQAEPEPVKKKVLRVPMARRGLGSKGQKIPILTNHFKVNVSNVDGHFFLTVLPYFMRMVDLSREKALAEKFWIECMKHMIQNWLGRILHMMGRRVCSPSVHYLEIN